MNSKELFKNFKNKDGFWVKIKDLNNDEITGCAGKILIKDGFLTLYTILENTPAINIYDSNHFIIYSSDSDVVLNVLGKGEFYDYWGPDLLEDPECYTKKYLKNGELGKVEFLKYCEPAEVNDLPVLKMLEIIEKIKPVNKEEQNKLRKMLGLKQIEEVENEFEY